MKELQELRNEVLSLRNIGELTKQTEIILLHKLNALQEAINYTHCCTELKDKHKISFNDWLRVNCEPTKNRNLFIKNKKLLTRLELVSMYEKE